MTARSAVLACGLLLGACAGGFQPFTPSPDDPATAARIAAAEAGPVPELGALPQRPDDVRTGREFSAEAAALAANGRTAMADPAIQNPEPRSSPEAFIREGRAALSAAVRDARERRPGEPVLAPELPPAS